MKVIITISESALPIARTIQREWMDAGIIRMSDSSFLSEHWKELECVIFVGALGICVRTIAPLLEDKYTGIRCVTVHRIERRGGIGIHIGRIGAEFSP